MRPLDAVKRVVIKSKVDGVQMRVQILGILDAQVFKVEASVEKRGGSIAVSAIAGAGQS